MVAKGQGRLFRIVGVPGCGKTTITTILGNLIQGTAGLASRLDVRQVQCQLAGVESDEQYRKIPEEKRRELFPLIVRRITEVADQHPDRIWFFERHLCSMDEKRGTIITRGIPDEHGVRMVGQAIILAREEQIVSWRQMDKIRLDRHLLTADQIAMEQMREIELAIEATRRWNFPTRFFFNANGISEKVATEVLDFVQYVCRHV